MKVRSLALAQIVLGVIFLLAGGVVIAIYSWMITGITGELSGGIKGLAEQVDLTASTVEQQQKVFDQFDQTADSYKALIQTTKHSCDELAKQRESWNKSAQDVGNTVSSVGRLLRSIGEALDLPLKPIVHWGTVLKVPYPNDITFEHVDMIHERCARLSNFGDDAVSLGGTIRTTVSTGSEQLGQLQQSLGTAADSSVSMIETVRVSLQSVKKQDLPRLVREMRESHDRLVQVSEQTRLIGPLLIATGCLGVGAGLICVVNALTLLTLEKRVRRFEDAKVAAV